MLLFKVYTNLTLKCQSAKRFFVIIVKSITPSLVSWGTPLLRNSNLIVLHLFLQPAVCLLGTLQYKWGAWDQPLVFATQSLRCYGQLDQSLSRSQQRRPALLDQHNLLPHKWLVTWIEEHLLSSGLYMQTYAGRFFHVIMAVVYCMWIPPWLLPVYKWALLVGDHSLFLLVGLPSELGWQWKILEVMGCILP